MECGTRGVSLEDINEFSGGTEHLQLVRTELQGKDDSICPSTVF